MNDPILRAAVLRADQQPDGEKDLSQRELDDVYGQTPIRIGGQR
ncbi:hypothetical protein [Streptomyces sp. NPDC049879]